METLGLEDFRTLGETKEARDKRQDLGLEDFRTLRLKMKEARDKRQEARFWIGDLAIVGIVTNETGESNEPMMRILSVVCIAKLAVVSVSLTNLGH